MKRTICLAIAICMMLAFAGCNSSNEDSSTTTATTTQATTATPTTTPSTAPSVSGDESLYQPEDIPSAFWDVLNNKQPFMLYDRFDGTFSQQNLDDYVFPYPGGPIATSSVSYIVVDLDNDGEKELILDQFDRMVLRHNGGTVYGYLFPEKWMINVYPDGSYTGANTYERFYHRLSFGSDNIYQIHDLTKVVLDESFTPIEYYIDGQLVDEATYTEYSQNHPQEFMKLKTLGRYPLENYKSPEMMG